MPPALTEALCLIAEGTAATPIHLLVLSLQVDWGSDGKHEVWFIWVKGMSKDKYKDYIECNALESRLQGHDLWLFSSNCRISSTVWF